MNPTEESPNRRISVDLPSQLIDRFDQLKKEWGLRGRGAVLKRLLEEILLDNSEDETESSIIDNELELGSQLSLDTKLSEYINSTSNYNESTALVLTEKGELESKSNTQTSLDDKYTFSTKNNVSTKKGIDLPGFVSKRTQSLRKSLGTQPTDSSENDFIMPKIKNQYLNQALNKAKSHWLSLYGNSPSETVVEAAMLWLAKDIWKQIDGNENTTFTWTAANRRVKELCPDWNGNTPTFENVIVIAGVLEDPFGSKSLSERIPTLIRRFVNRFKRSRNVTSFETLESTMTVHGALKLLDLPTQAGYSMTLGKVREAYKTKAMTIHPDAGGSTEDMRRLNEAYQLLKELYRSPK